MAATGVTTVTRNQPRATALTSILRLGPRASVVTTVSQIASIQPMPISELIFPMANFRQPSAQPTAALQTVHDTNLSKQFGLYDPTLDESLGICWLLPGNYLAGNVTAKVRWRANATTGDCVWRGNYVFQTSGALVTAGTTNHDVTTTTDSTAYDINETTHTLSNGVAASRLVCYQLYRFATTGSDTLAVDAEVEEVVFSYLSDGLTNKQYIWIPGDAFMIPPSSAATITTQQVTGFCWVGALSLPDAGGYGDYRLNLPSSFNGGAQVTVVGTNGANAGVVGFTLGAGSAAPGASIDPSLTTTSSFGFSPANSNRINFTAPQALPISPSASDDLVLRLSRDTGDANTGAISVLGVLLEFSVISADPGPVRLDPTSGTVPASDFATLSQVNGTNSSYSAALFADGVTQSIDLVRYVPGIYSSGGTLRLRWSSPAASGNVRLQVSHASPAVGSPSDPSLSAGTATDYATAGANLINETTVNISSGLAAGDVLNLRITRLGSHANDTLGNAFYLFDAVVEVTPST